MWIIWKVFIDALLLLMGFYFILSCLCHRLYLSLVFSIFVSLGKSFNEIWWSVRIILFLVLSRQNISDVAPRKLPIYGLCWQSSMLCFFFLVFFFVVWANLWHVSQDSQNSYWHEILLVLTDTSPFTFLSSWIIFFDCGQNLLTSELWPLTHTRRVEPPASVSGVK